MTDVDASQGNKDAAEWCAYLVKCFNSFNLRLQKQGISSAQIDRIALVNTVISIFHDIDRVENYHGMKPPSGRADRFKRAGYTMKWISKIKPVNLDSLADLPHANEKLLLLTNEAFALAVGMNMSCINHETAPANLASEIMYDLHYRHIEGGIMAQLLKLASQLWPKPDNKENAAR